MEDRKLIRLINRNPEKGISLALDLYGSQWAEIQGDPYSLIDVAKVAGLSFDGQMVEFK